MEFALFHIFDLTGPGVETPSTNTSPPRLTPGEATTLVYSIRPVRRDNYASTGISGDLKERIAVEDTVHLMAYFSCGVCAPEDSEQPPQKIVVGKGGSRGVLQFEFTPVADPQPRKPLMPEGLRIDLFDSAGVRYDQVELCVEVEAQTCTGDQRLVMTEGRELNSHASLSVAVDTIQQPPRLGSDVVITISEPGKGQERVPIFLQISSPKLIDDVIARLREKGKNTLVKRLTASMAEGGKPELSLEGQTEFSSLKALNAETRAAYYRLTCMISADEALVSALGQQNPVSCANALDKSLAVLSTPNWSEAPKARTRAHLQLQELGDRLFTSIFADPDLAAVMTVLSETASERANQSPISVRIFSGSEHIPFQLFHAPGNASDAFFGLRFDIFDAIRPPKSRSAPRYEGFISLDETTDPVVGLYTENVAVTPDTQCDTVFTSDLYLDQAINRYPRGETKAGTAEAKAADAARVARLACESYKDLLTSLGGGGRAKAPAVNARDFISGSKTITGLTEQAATSKLIWFYGHGLSRDTASAKTDVEQLRQAESSLNSQLIFAEFDDDISLAHLWAAQLDDLKRSKKNVLTQAPLVVLLACELGATKGNATGVAMTDAFVALGARGVVSAEAELDAQSARLFGQYLIAELQLLTPDKGPSRAVLAARRKIYDAYGGNLWPLLIYYAGSPGPYLSR